MANLKDIAKLAGETLDFIGRVTKSPIVSNAQSAIDLITRAYNAYDGARMQKVTVADAQAEIQSLLTVAAVIDAEEDAIVKERKAAAAAEGKEPNE